MENYNFNFKKYNKYLSEIEKNSQKKLLNSNDGKICWRSWGKGTPLILLHGGYGSWNELEQFGQSGETSGVF